MVISGWGHGGIGEMFKGYKLATSSRDLMYNIVNSTVLKTSYFLGD